MTFVLGYPLYQVRKVCGLTLCIVDILTQRSHTFLRKVCVSVISLYQVRISKCVAFVLGYPLYQVRKVCGHAFVLGYPLYQVRKVCGLCVRISTIPSEESVCTFVLGYPLYQVRKVCAFVLGYPLYQVRKVCAFVLGYPLYQVRKVCCLCVRISTIPSEESV